MKINLRETNKDEKKDYVGVALYSKDKQRLDKLASSMGVSLSVVLRTAVNNLLDSEDLEEKTNNKG